jgi:hypothetical protein
MHSFHLNEVRLMVYQVVQTGLQGNCVKKLDTKMSSLTVDASEVIDKSSGYTLNITKLTSVDGKI